MNEKQKEFEMLDYFSMLRRHKWIMIAAVVIVTGLGTLYTLRQTPIYRSTVTILIEREAPRVVETSEVVTLGALQAYEDYYNTQIKILESRDIREKAVSRIGSKDDVFGKLTIEPVKKSWLVKLSADNPDPAKAALVANTVAEVFVEENLARKMKTVGDAQFWLLNQINEEERKLQQAEKVLEDYRRRTGEISLDQAQDITVTRLKDLNAAYTNAQDVRIKAHAQYSKFKNWKLEDSDFLPDIIENGLILSLRRELITKENDYRKLAERFTSTHPEMVRLQSQITDIQEKIAQEIDTETAKLKSEKIIEVNEKTRQYRRDYESALQHENDLKAQLDAQEKAAMHLSSSAVNYNILKRAADTSRELYQMLLTQAQETGLTSELRGNNISILDRAEQPRTPISPKTNRNILASILLGLVLGAGLVLFTNYMHDTINGPEDIKSALHNTGVKLLSTIPHIKAGKDKEDIDTITEREFHSQANNAFGLLRTNILFPPPEKEMKNILITSAIRAEGKTFVAANLAIAFAHVGFRTLIVDTDLRKPRMHKIFNLKGEKGLTDYLVGEASMEEIIHKLAIDNLSIIECGEIPHEPEPLLSSPKMQDLSRLLKENFDYIIYDTPPLVPIADSILLSATVADKTIIVAKSENTPKRMLKQAYEMLEEARQGIVGGVIINDISRESNYRYYKYYSGYYTEKKKA
jgi:polysaccharide biosynthesis transport protein